MLLERVQAKIRSASENERLIFLNALGAFLVKGGALIVSLLTMPAFIRYLDNQAVLGLWFTILSVLTLFMTFDLGIGSGLRNRLVPALTADDRPAIRQYVSSAYVAIGLIALMAVGVSAVLFRFVDWNAVFNIAPGIVPASVLIRAVFIVFAGIMLQFLLRLITSILYAMQLSAMTNLLSLITSVLIYVYLLMAPSSDVATNLTIMAIVYALAINGPLLVATIVVFSGKLKGCRPQFRSFDFSRAKEVLKLGGLFFWIQTMYFIIAAMNEYLISYLAGPEYVVDYQIYHRLFTLLGTVYYLALTPIWSAVTKAQAEKNFTWIRKLYRTLKSISVIAFVCEFALILVLQWLIDLWLGERAIPVHYLYATIFAISGCIYIWHGVHSSITNGCGELKGQSVFFTIGALIHIPLSMFLVSWMQTWIGVVLSNVLSLSLYCVIQPIWLDRFIREQERKQLLSEVSVDVS